MALWEKTSCVVVVDGVVVVVDGDGDHDDEEKDYEREEEDKDNSDVSYERPAMGRTSSSDDDDDDDDDDFERGKEEKEEEEEEDEDAKSDVSDSRELMDGTNTASVAKKGARCNGKQLCDSANNVAITEKCNMKNKSKKSRAALKAERKNPFGIVGQVVPSSETKSEDAASETCSVDEALQALKAKREKLVSVLQARRLTCKAKNDPLCKNDG